MGPNPDLVWFLEILLTRLFKPHLTVGILRRAQKVEALLFRKPIKNIHFKKTPFLKITNFAYFGFITFEFSDIFDP